MPGNDQTKICAATLPDPKNSISLPQSGERPPDTMQNESRRIERDGSCSVATLLDKVATHEQVNAINDNYHVLIVRTWSCSSVSQPHEVQDPHQEQTSETGRRESGNGSLPFRSIRAGRRRREGRRLSTGQCRPAKGQTGILFHSILSASVIISFRFHSIRSNQIQTGDPFTRA